MPRIRNWKQAKKRKARERWLKGHTIKKTKHTGLGLWTVKFLNKVILVMGIIFALKVGGFI